MKLPVSLFLFEGYGSMLVKMYIPLRKWDGNAIFPESGIDLISHLRTHSHDSENIRDKKIQGKDQGRIPKVIELNERFRVLEHTFLFMCYFR